MIQIQIDQPALEAIINTAVERAVSAERAKQHEVKLITGEELCAKFGVTRATLQKWKDKKEIPYVQIDGTIRYDFNKIIQLKEAKRKR